jgi:hypothetical protein
LTDIENLNAIGVPQVGAQARLIQEHPDELCLPGKVRKNALDGDLLLEPFKASTLCPEDFGHPSRGDALDDTVSLLGS